jgi:hypothetical protein
MHWASPDSKQILDRASQQLDTTAQHGPLESDDDREVSCGAWSSSGITGYIGTHFAMPAPVLLTPQK